MAPPPHAEHHDGRAADDIARDRGADEGDLRQNAEQHQDAAAGRDHIAAEHAGNLQQADVLGIGRIGEGVEQAADDVADAIGAQTTGEIALADLAACHAKIRELSERYALDVRPDAIIEDLSVGEQQRVEILKALFHGVDLLILDEPTAVLTPQETDRLLALMGDLVKDGKTIVFISHKLDEVMRVSNRISVMRDGRVVRTVNVAETDARNLARMMVGRDVRMMVAAGDAWSTNSLSSGVAWCTRPPAA